jgi:hypothetical protein
MNLTLSKFKTAARTALVAASLAASVVAMPTPTMAQPHIELDFSFPGFSIGIGSDPDHCATRSEIRRFLRENDFYDIEITSFTSTRARARAYWEEDDEQYAFRFRRCPLDVTSIRPV